MSKHIKRQPRETKNFVQILPEILWNLYKKWPWIEFCTNSTGNSAKSSKICNKTGHSFCTVTEGHFHRLQIVQPVRVRLRQLHLLHEPKPRESLLKNFIFAYFQISS